MENQNKDEILLLISDEQKRSKFVKILTDLDYLVKDFCTTSNACNCLDHGSLDCVVVDVSYEEEPKLDNLFKKVKESSSYTKIIVITNETRAIAKPNIDEWVCESLGPEELLGAIKRNVKICKLEKENSSFTDQIQKLEGKLGAHYYDAVNDLVAKAKELSLLFEISKEITSSLTIDDVLDTIVKRTGQVLGVDMCSILLLDEVKNELFIAAAKGLPEEVIASTRVKLGDKISGWVLQNKKPILVQEIEKDSRFLKTSEHKYYTGSFISVPLIFKDKAIGVLSINNKYSREVFTEEDLKLVEGIADHASIAIENARLYKNLQGVYMQIITTLTSTIQVKDNYTKGHSERVTDYAVSIAEGMALSKRQIEIIKVACQLHDLGKIGIPEHILTKPGKLTEEEWNEIRMHPQKGVEILKPLAFLNDVITLVEQHHEHYNGKGYPCGLKGEEIELGARIICVADAFDAMTTKRSYAGAMPIDLAIEEMERCKETQFDPRVVESFIDLLKKDLISLDDK